MGANPFVTFKQMRRQQRERCVCACVCTCVTRSFLYIQQVSRTPKAFHTGRGLFHKRDLGLVLLFL